MPSSTLPKTPVEKIDGITPAPPLLDIKITNPVTYLKIWWHRVMANEGIDFRFRIHPVTALTLSAVLAGGSFGLGHITWPKTITQYVPQLIPAEPVNNTGFTGTLHYNTSSKTYYLATTAAQAITLEVPYNVDLSIQVNKRIFASGNYNAQTKVLKVSAASDLELLPTKQTTVPVTK